MTNDIEIFLPSEDFNTLESELKPSERITILTIKQGPFDTLLLLTVEGRTVCVRRKL